MIIFESLSEKENQILTETISNITLYIASADGNIANEELEWAKKVTHIRSYQSPKQLEGFYSVVQKNFEDLVESKLQNSNAPEIYKNAEIALTKSAEVVAKLDASVAADLVESFRSFAKHVAKSEGGFLGIGEINSDEHKALSLDMFN